MPEIESSNQERTDARREQIAQDIGRERLYELEYQNPVVLEAAFAEGYTLLDVAVAFDVSTATVHRWKDRNDVPSPRDRDLPDDFGERVAVGQERERERRERISRSVKD